MPIDIALAMTEIRAAEKEALRKLGEIVQEQAQSRAPVRKLGRERRGRTRKLNKTSLAAAIRVAEKYHFKSEFERRAAIAFLRNYGQERIPRRGVKRRALRIGTVSQVYLKGSTYMNSKASIGTKMRPRRGTTVTRLNLISRTAKPKKGFELDAVSMDRLSPRGRHEVRSGRAVSQLDVKGGTGIEVGGTLKKSISSSGALDHDHGYRVEITANVPYARYVEFPTSHNAAQPFLLPALMDAKKITRREFDAALRERGLKGGR